jgi:hypothetical protein
MTNPVLFNGDALGLPTVLLDVGNRAAWQCVKSDPAKTVALFNKLYPPHRRNGPTTGLSASAGRSRPPASTPTARMPKRWRASSTEVKLFAAHDGTHALMAHLTGHAVHSVSVTEDADGLGASTVLVETMDEIPLWDAMQFIAAGAVGERLLCPWSSSDSFGGERPAGSTGAESDRQQLGRLAQVLAR